MDKPLFNLATLPEADEFLDSLAAAVVRKVFYNIQGSRRRERPGTV